MLLNNLSIKQVLETLPLFVGVQSSCLDHLADHCRIFTCKRGELLFRKGDVPDGFCYLMEGKMKLFFLSSRGRERVFEVLGAGSIFADEMMFVEEPYPIDAEALVESQLLFVLVLF